MNKRQGTLVVTALALTGLLAGCAGGDTPAPAPSAEGEGLVIGGELIADQELYDAAKGQTLTIYTGLQESNQLVLNEEFTKDTGIAVEYVRAVPNQLVERVLSEAGANQLPADVIITSNYNIAHDMGEAGIWEPHRALPVADQDDFFLDGDDFMRFSLVAVTIGYNTQLVSEADAPTSWSELLDPKWDGKLATSVGTAGGSMVALNRFVAEEVDPDFWEKMAKNNPVIMDSAGASHAAVARGEVSLAVVGTAGMNLLAENENAPVDIMVGDEGLVLFNFFAGRTTAGSSPEAAQVYLNWSMSKRGQEVIAGYGDYAVRADVAPPVAIGHTLPALDSGGVWIMPPEAELEYGAADAEVWKKAFGR